jgi:hypothetical protein
VGGARRDFPALVSLRRIIRRCVSSRAKHPLERLALGRVVVIQWTLLLGLLVVLLPGQVRDLMY